MLGIGEGRTQKANLIEGDSELREYLALAAPAAHHTPTPTNVLRTSHNAIPNSRSPKAAEAVYFASVFTSVSAEPFLFDSHPNRNHARQKKGTFQLPQLTPVSFSLTDGTNIPPPPDSPIEEKPPPPVPTKQTAPEPQTQTQTQAQNGANGGGDYVGRGRTNGNTNSSDVPPLSPASARRPSSIRKFLSRKSLNAHYTNGNASRDDLTSMGRPDSPASFMTNVTASGSGKKGSWFKRLGGSGGGGGGGNRTSVVYETPPRVESVVPEKKKMGPPPPKLPELSKLKAKIPEDDEGSLGADEMFKNIK
ncbi:hypothetical protein LSUB1_G006105 [Lachnellula subtilissima]|uniref:Uncharacterized protein n=1 Tax=Lachnellula subtilissima TaxID=602034 RepID=A0A8H8RE09_9HELO|nr:hypothetical protein LSUB1_G006105 [Lachnellula subtilissima]